MMRTFRAMLLVIPAVLVCLPAVGQSARPSLQTQAGAARMVLESQEIDFGKVDDITFPEGEIRFRNEGDAPLEISLIKGSCRCTVPELEKRVYEPGESGVMKIELKTTGYDGRMAQNVRIESNDAMAPSRVVSVRAEVIPVVQLSLKNITFGSVNKGAGGEQMLVVTGPDEKFTVTALRMDRPDAFAAEVVSTEVLEVDDRLNGGKKMASVTTVKVSVLPSAPVGTQLNGTLRVVTNHKDLEVMQVRANAIVRGDLRIEPQRFSLGVMRPGQSFEKRIRVRTDSGDAFEITGTVPVMPVGRDLLANSEFEVVPADDGDGYFLIMRGVATDVPTPTRGYVLIRTDIEGEPVMRAPISGMIRKVQPGNLNR